MCNKARKDWPSFKFLWCASGRLLYKCTDPGIKDGQVKFISQHDRYVAMTYDRDMADRRTEY